ncbi:MAG: hypothetical protein U9Q03_06375 [Patescibacteria group bacterium]|nr:hypothetical protein [Patescibacteria group bacterium]
MYLEISNTGCLHRDEVRLIGFSAKADAPPDSNIIGQFGTGTAFATVAALRLGLEVAITSTDAFGRYFLRFELEDIDMGGGKKSQEIYLQYWTINDDGEAVRSCRKPWNIVIEAFRQWDKPIGDDDAKAFKILREFICNARDEDQDFTISEVKEQCFAPEGRTSVYLFHTDEVKKVLDTPERYFKFLVKDISTIEVPGIGRLTSKSEKDALGKSRMFVQDILVSCDEDFLFNKALLDYSLNDRTLVSEDRTIKRTSDFRKALGRLIANIPDEALVRVILSQVINGESGVEQDALGYVLELKDPAKGRWLKALRANYKWDKLCLASGLASLDEDARQIYGYLPITVDSDLERFFGKALGIPKARDIVPNKPKYAFLRFRDLDEGSRHRFMAAFRIFARLFPHRVEYPIVFFLSDNEEEVKRVCAYAGGGEEKFTEIWIHALSPTELRDTRTLLSSLIHESRHNATKMLDYDRGFVAAAEDDILHLVCHMMGMGRNMSGELLKPLGDPDRIKPNIKDQIVIDEEAGD